MAFSAVTERGSASERAADATLAVSPSANITVGKIAFAYAVIDNIATSTGASTDLSIADTDTHTWAKLFERTYAPTAAIEVGVTHALWWTKVTTQIDTTDAITLTASTTAVSKVLMVFECTITGSTIQLANDGTPSAFQESTTATPSVATSGMTSQEYLHIGAMAVEDETLTWTEDADYTNVFASEGVSSGPTGGAGSNVTGFLGYRIATLTGDTFAPSYGAPRDIAIALVALEEVSGGSATVTPGVIARSFTVPAVTVKGAAVTAPSAIARSVTTPAVTVKGAARTTPAAVAAVVTNPAPTVKGAAVTTPAAVARSFTVPQATASAGGTPGSVTPDAIARSFTVPASTQKGGAVTTPATVARSFTLDAVTVKGSAKTTPDAIARSFTVPQATPSEGATPGSTAPDVIARSFTVPAPTVKGAAVTTPAVVARSFTLDAVTVKGAAKTTPDVVARSFTLDAVTVKGSAVAAPGTIARSFSFGALAVMGGGVVTPAVIPLSVVIPAVTVSSVIPDFWNYNPAGYARNSAGFTINPAPYTPVTKDDDPPWD